MRSAERSGGSKERSVGQRSSKAEQHTGVTTGEERRRGTACGGCGGCSAVHTLRRNHRNRNGGQRQRKWRDRRSKKGEKPWQTRGEDRAGGGEERRRGRDIRTQQQTQNDTKRPKRNKTSSIDTVATHHSIQYTHHTHKGRTSRRYQTGRDEGAHRTAKEEGKKKKENSNRRTNARAQESDRCSGHERANGGRERGAHADGKRQITRQWQWEAAISKDGRVWSRWQSTATKCGL